MNTDGQNRVKPVEKIAELNKWIEQFAKENKAEYVDCYTPMLDSRKGMKAEYSNDGVHPTRRRIQGNGTAGCKSYQQGLKEKIKP